MNILVVEDEKELNRMIRDYLESLGWNVFGAVSGSEALDIFRSQELDFILLDIMMPGLDGLDVIRRIREKSEVPVIFITAMAEESDKLIGLEIGADDYITKPFSLKEMAARIRTVMRRVEKPEPTEEKEPVVLKVGDLSMDAEKRTIRLGEKLLDVTTVQFDILHGFMRHPGRVFTRTEILEFFQEHAWEGYERTIDVHIKNIRKQLKTDQDNSRYLQTVRGVGYRLSDGEEP
ncbi:MAG: hypothetical protein B0D92_01500 [Spirochaeta sp. LUC14_002_19_P3]|nr:MAG: hypothetical protein B0D92_01500 [Spirochaeta sp. LUC14_002_19_P3]